MTTRIFDNEPYLTEAKAKVISIEKTTLGKEEVFAVVLDQTIFFPEEGGQSPDKGTIEGKKVVDVQVKGADIVHYLEISKDVEMTDINHKAFSGISGEGTECVQGSDEYQDETGLLGKEVSLKIDWQHRFNNMQQHSGEHIFSGLVHRLYGYDNVGFHLSDNSVTMDFNGVLTDDDLAKIEYLVNEAIAKNVPITARYVERDELKTLEYRSKKEIDGDVRIVTIEGYDDCACCAPHVKRTGEIGGFKIINSMNYKGGVRIEFRCGFRALEHFRNTMAIVDSLTSFLSTGSDKLLDQVERLREDNQRLSGELLEVKKTLLMQELNGIPVEQVDVIFFTEKIDNVLMKIAVNELAENHSGMVLFFSGSDEAGYNYMLVSKDKDMRALQKILNEKLGAKGGGKPDLVCGSVMAGRAEIENIINEILV